MARLEYPLNRDQRFKSRISFQAIKVIPPKFSAKFGASQTADENKGSTNIRREKSSVDVISSLKVIPIAGENVGLYVPLAFNVGDGFGYNQASLGTAGAVIAKGLNSGAGIGGSVLGALKETGQSIFDFFGGIGGGDISRLAAVRGAELAPIGDNARTAIGLTARVTMNPNIRTQFQGVDIREFSFQFKFIPTSSKEAETVKNIVQFFRLHAYPEELGDLGTFSFAYDYPNMFKIKLLSESEEGPVGEGGQKIFKHIGTPIKMCYLKSIQTSYNPTAAVLHKDGSPSEIDLSLTFTEYKALSRKDIKNENNDTFYNFENSSTSETGGR